MTTVSSGVTSSYTTQEPGLTVDSGGTVIVLSGGETIGAIVDGLEKVSAGGSARATSVSSGGLLAVSSGGSATLTTVKSGGTLEMLSGGSKLSSFVEAGGTIAFAGGYVGGYGLGSGATLLVEEGATDSGSTISAGGMEIVSGVASVTTIAGSQSVYGAALSNTVADGGSQTIFAGGIATSTTVASGATLLVEKDGTDSGSKISAGGMEIVSGVASVTTIAGSQSVYYATLSNTVAYGGVQTVFAGGSAAFGTVDSGGSEIVTSGGQADAATVLAGGSATILAGGSAFDTNIAGSQTVYGTTLNDKIQNGGTETVAAGGSATSATVDSGGTLELLGGGSQLSTTVKAGGAIAFGGGYSGSYALGSGATLLVQGGGTDSGSTISAGGVEIVSLGGLAVATSIAGKQTVYGTAQGNTVEGGASQTVIGFAVSTSVVGSQLVYGIAQNDTVQSGGSEIIASGGQADTATVLAGGSATISAGGAAFGTDIAGSQTVYGTTFSDAVQDGGIEILAAGGSATSATVDSGGTLELLSGGSQFSTTIEAGGTIAFTGGYVGSYGLGSGATLLVEGAGTDSGSTISAGGVEIVAGGGFAADTFIAGSQSVYGVTLSNTVADGGIQTLFAGSAVVDTVDSGGTFEVLNGALELAGVVSAGGSEIVGGAALFTDIAAGGTQIVSLGGVAGNTDIAGSQSVYGEALDDTVESGGVQVVSSGGVASNTVINGGTLDVQAGGYVSGSVTFEASGGVLQIDGAALPNSPTPIIDAVISGFSSGDAIDLTGINYDPNGSVTMLAGNTLQVVENGASYDLLFDPSQNFSGTYFHLAADGTEIIANDVPCFLRGTLIMTPDGEVPVEGLAIGDRVNTLSGETRPVHWIGRRGYAGRFASGNRKVMPIRIRAGALSDGMPRRDLLVSPEHAMFVDGMLIPAIALVNGASIIQAEDIEQVEYFHIDLGTHDVIFAEGAATESFVDDGSRGMFHNAAEYDRLYPDAARPPVRFCAPRLEDGEALEAIRQRILARTRPATAAPGQLRGYLEHVCRNMIEGWAQDLAAPDRPVRLRILDNDVAIAEVVADRHRRDLEDAGIGNGCHSFSLIIPGGLSPLRRHVITAQRAEDGAFLMPLNASVLEPEPAAVGTAEVRRLRQAPNFGTQKRAATRQGYLDFATRERIGGWAIEGAGGNAPLFVQVLDNDELVAHTLANRYRGDLAAAGFGDGRHSFEVQIPGGLSPQIRHVIRVQFAADGAELTGSPMVIEKADMFDTAVEQMIERAVTAADAEREQARVLSFLVAQADQLLRRHAEATGRREARLAYRQFRRRWGSEGAAEDAALTREDPGRRALVIDDTLPAADRDAGSQAIVSHMRALRHLGYAVSFAPANEDRPNARDAAALADEGITCYHAPFYASVEDVLRRQAGCFDLIYLHRAASAAKYMALARHYAPNARILYGLADLHHLRLARQAEVEDRPELMVESRRLWLLERTASCLADAVVTHSESEAAWLRRTVPNARVHVVPWEVPSSQNTAPFGERSGIAFIGYYGHQPNVDAACWLVEEIMPLVWRVDPAIECRLVGSCPPDRVSALARPGVVLLGHVPDLSEVLGGTRLTVAPLRYGAGIKGKVLASLAAGLPCVMSPVAAEGLHLPAALDGCIARNVTEFAARLLHLYTDPQEAKTVAEAGMAMIQEQFSATRVINALRCAAEGQQAPSSPRRAAGGA